MAPPAPHDPRRVNMEGGDLRPQVAVPRGGMPLWLMLLGIGAAAIVLFSLLNARRLALSAPPVHARYDEAVGTAQSAPPLFIPPAPIPVPPPLPTPTPVAAPTPKRAPILVPPPPPQIIYVPQPAPPAPAYQPALPRASNEPVLIIDTGTAAPAASPNGMAAVAGTEASDGTFPASRATVLRHRATIVAQGTLIPAVLESALDSTRAGSVRALVSRDVRGFDGTHVLVPRGSRLFGDYRADLQPGQNRALIMWTRLVRPDGVTIAIGSPASDPLGQAGVRGKVNSHFFAKFGAAVLQSALDVGVNLASRIGSSNSAVVVALPSTTQALSRPLAQGAQIQPTLKVRQGTTISVFVARDLDFTAVESGK